MPGRIDRARRDGALVASLRKQIDRLDRQLLTLLNARARLALRLGRVKRRQGRPVLDKRREQQVLRRIQRANRGPLPRTAVQEIFGGVLEGSRRLERRGR